MHELIDWTIRNDQGLEIIGNTHRPAHPRACVILLHGFKGYKDYGFIPVLASMLADTDVCVHRFNFSTSGMTNDIATFARPDLFALDTWNRQVDDVRRVVRAIRDDELFGRDLPISIVGHSRGGATAILAAARHADELDLACVVTINAVDSCGRMSEEDRRAMREQGYTTTHSARTDQELRIGRAWLDEQIEDPNAHDILALCERVACPILVMHADQDDAVPLRSGENIADACGVSLKIIEGANHVLNTANPAKIGDSASDSLMFAFTNIADFLLSRLN